MGDLIQREPIQYIRSEIPRFDIPAYRGERYEAFVPDTIDWQERAGLAIHALTSATDPDADHETWWRVVMHGDRPIMLHDNNDQVQNEMQQSLVLLRMMTGSDSNEQVDVDWMSMLLHMQGPDGLLYYPVRGRPWQRLGVDGAQYGGLPEGDHATGPYNNGEILGAVALYYLRSGNRVWKDLGVGVVDGLARLGVDRGDYVFYPKGMYGLGEISDQAAPIPAHSYRNMALGWMAQGVLRFARASGHEPALNLGTKLLNFVRRHAGMYAGDGNWLPDNPRQSTSTHFHAHTYPLVGMLEQAVLTGDRDLMDFVNTGYEYGKAHGETITGFFPEHLHTGRLETRSSAKWGT